MASPGDKVDIGPRLDPGISELFSSLDEPVIPRIYSLCQGHAEMFGNINPPISSPFPVLELGDTHWVGRLGWLWVAPWWLSSSSALPKVPLVLSCRNSHGVWPGWVTGGGLSSSPAAAILELLFKALRIPGKTNPEQAEW